MEARLMRSFYLWLLILAAICIQTVAANSQTPALIPAEIIGRWVYGTNSRMYEYTNAQPPRNISAFVYKFSPDGRFEFSGVMSSTENGCTTTLSNHKTGRVSVNGSKMTFAPDKNYWKNTFSCTPEKNKERDYVLDEETYDWRLKQDDSGRKQICLTGAKGTEYCYRQAE